MFEGGRKKKIRCSLRNADNCVKLCHMTRYDDNNDNTCFPNSIENIRQLTNLLVNCKKKGCDTVTYVNDEDGITYNAMEDNHYFVYSYIYSLWSAGTALIDEIKSITDKLGIKDFIVVPDDVTKYPENILPKIIPSLPTDNKAFYDSLNDAVSFLLSLEPISAAYGKKRFNPDDKAKLDTPSIELLEGYLEKFKSIVGKLCNELNVILSKDDFKDFSKPKGCDYIKSDKSKNKSKKRRKSRKNKKNKEINSDSE